MSVKPVGSSWRFRVVPYFLLREEGGDLQDELEEDYSDADKQEKREDHQEDPENPGSSSYCAGHGSLLDC